MQLILLKGSILLLGIVSGMYLVSAESLLTLVNGSEIEPIAVERSANLNRNDQEQLKGFLFGSAQAADLQITETSLGFVLKGTIPSNNKEKSLAIISLTGKKERVIGVGEELIERVVLLEVLNNYVIILREGKREKISFPEVNRVGLIASRSTSQPADESVSTTTVPSTIAPQVTNQPQTQGESLVVDDSAQPIDSDVYDKTLDTTQNTVLEQAGREQTGLSVTGSGLTVSANSELVNLGLQQGDTVLSINGISANQLVGDSKVMSTIKQAGDASVLVKRGVDTLTIKIKL